MALLLTLGVLSLLLILAMSFAYSARTNRMSSQVNADVVKARLLCEAGLERAMAYVQTTYSATGAVTPPSSYYPGTSGFFAAGPTGSPWEGRRYAVSQQATPDALLVESALAVDMGFDFTPKWSAQLGGANQLHADQSWHPIKDATSTSLIGRVAFLLIDESGKIDPTAAVSFHEPFIDTNDDGNCVGEVYWDLDGNGSYTGYVLAPPSPTPVIPPTLAEGSERRLGASPEEIPLFFTGITGNEFGTEMLSVPRPTPVPAWLPQWTPTQWFSWYDLSRCVTSMNATEASTLTRTLYPFSYDIEAWDDAGTDRHRFDLVGTDWTTQTLATVSAAATPFWDTTVTPNTIQPSTGGIPWLSGLVDNAAVDVSNQVSANLIDYCDANDAATSDYVAALGNWAPPGAPRTLASATYVGLEKTPYVNEVGFVVVRTFFPPPPGPPRTDIVVTVQVELINIYDDDLTIPAGGLALDVQYVGLPAPTQPNNVGTTFLSGAAIPVSAHSYQAVTMATTLSIPGGGGAPINFGVQAVTAMVSSPSGGLWDFASIGASGTALINPPFDTCSATVEVVDPRCNTSATEWQWTGFAALVPGSPGKNTNTDATGGGVAGKDVEANADPAAGLSTAYIRDGPMVSLWELGAIHRGEQWSTLSLKAYNDGSLAKSCVNGDARILDQVKLGPATTVRGKVNPNSPQSTVWTALLYGLKRGDNTAGATDTTYADPAPAGAPVLTNTEITNLVTAVLNQNGGTAGTAFGGRGGVASTAALSDNIAVTQPADRQREEIIGKIANLLTTRQNLFTVLVTAQSVKDLGTVEAPGSTAWEDGAATKYLQVLAEQRVMATVYRDAYRNTFRIERYEFLEE